jgi:tricarballylate dehydrogenase
VVQAGQFFGFREQEAQVDGLRTCRWTMAYLRLDKDNNFDLDWKHEMKRVSNGLADQEYCARMEQEVPITAQYLIDHGVKFNHHDEKNVLLEFKTNQHFVFPQGGGHAIINALFDHIRKFDGVTVMWETQAEHLLTQDDGVVCGVKVRKSDGRMTKVHGKKVMLACGGFEGNREMCGSPNAEVTRQADAWQVGPICRTQNRAPRAHRSRLEVQYRFRVEDGFGSRRCR